jgi:heavy metal sensor kinase
VTLTARVSAFFLGWLGLALVGFAAAVYLVARADLHRQIDEQDHRVNDRLQGTLDTLVAAAEIHRNGLEWEAHERSLPRGGDGVHGVMWLVAVPGGRTIDRSGPAAGDWLRDGPEGNVTDSSAVTWRVARRRLHPGEPQVLPPENHLMANEPAALVVYTALDLTAAVPVTPIRNDLDRLAWLLAGLTVALWLLAVLIGRWLCRRTLAPVSDMAVAARELSPADPGERLAVRPTGDELEDLGRAFNEALGRMEEAFERQRRFTGDASHQLRTPLAAVLGQVEVALRRDRDPAEYRDTLRAVADEIRHLHRLTEALLFLARADAEAGLPDLQAVDLATWVADHVGKWRASHPGTDVRVDVDESTPSVRAHPELLAQLVDNLLDNALKYGPAGGPIQVRVAVKDGQAQLTVEDSGPGILPEDLTHVFDPFFRTAAARSAGIRGVGLGLAVARRIAEAMGARVTAESEPGRGSRFVLVFATVSS